jgi:hypothetical protein
MVPSIEHRDGNYEHLNEKRLTLKAPYKGVIEQLYTAPPVGSVVVCLDEMEAARSFPGQQLVTPAAPQAERARQEIDYDRRDAAGYVFGAFQPASSLSDLTKNGSEIEITMRFLGYIGNYITIYIILLIENCAKRLSPTGC